MKTWACAVTVSALLVACQGSSKDTSPRADVEKPSPPTPPRTGRSVTPATPATSSAPAAPPPPPTTVTTEALDVDGKERSFVLAIPTTYSKGRSYPLVLVLHGDGGDGAKMRGTIPFDAVSAQDAIVAYPSGTDGWNLYDPAEGNPDLAFLVALVSSLESRFTIDPARVFGLGFSSGAFMLNQVGCRRPSLFRAIVPHSGGAPNEPRDVTATRWENGYTRCAGQTMGSGPAVMVVHGTADTAVAVDSGEFTASYWAFVNGCETTRATPASPPPCVAQDGCPAGKPLVYCAIPELGHVYWSSTNQAAWQFFRDL